VVEDEVAGAVTTMVGTTRTASVGGVRVIKPLPTSARFFCTKTMGKSRCTVFPMALIAS
jgi:hypothetical protein